MNVFAPWRINVRMTNASFERRLCELERRRGVRAIALEFENGSACSLRIRDTLGLFLDCMAALHYFGFGRFKDPPEALPASLTPRRLEQIRLIGRAVGMEGPRDIKSAWFFCFQTVQIENLKTQAEVENILSALSRRQQKGERNGESEAKQAD